MKTVIVLILSHAIVLGGGIKVSQWLGSNSPDCPAGQICTDPTKCFGVSSGGEPLDSLAARNMVQNYGHWVGQVAKGIPGDRKKNDSIGTSSWSIPAGDVVSLLAAYDTTSLIPAEKKNFNSLYIHAYLAFESPLTYDPTKLADDEIYTGMLNSHLVLVLSDSTDEGRKERLELQCRDLIRPCPNQCGDKTGLQSSYLMGFREGNGTK